MARSLVKILAFFIINPQQAFANGNARAAIADCFFYSGCIAVMPVLWIMHFESLTWN